MDNSPIELVLFDVGGVIYDDACYARALLRAGSELAGPIAESEFWPLYYAALQSQSSLRSTVARAFGLERAELAERVERYWDYGPEDLHREVPAALERLAGQYALGIVANQTERVREALRRDRLEDLFSTIVLSAEVGVEKPEPEIFEIALRRVGVDPARAVHVGNRLVNDVRAARSSGLRPIWVLRGEAPPAPSHEQLGEAAAVLSSLRGLPWALARLEGRDG